MRNKFEYVADKCQCVYSACACSCACVVYGACLVLVLVYSACVCASAVLVLVYSACVCASAVLVYSACVQCLCLCTVLVSHQIEQLDSLASLPDGAWPTNKKASHICFQTLNQL